jgi:large subunit ribosomal protein L9
MKVILIKDIKGIGKSGELLDVADGYGRNYLVPSGFAQVWDPKTYAALAQKKAIYEEKTKNDLLKSRQLVEKLAAGALEFRLKADEKGHLYAGLKEEEILAKIRKGQDSSFTNGLKLVDYSVIKQMGAHKVKVKSGSKTFEVNIIILAANEKEQVKR